MNCVITSDDLAKTTLFWTQNYEAMVSEQSAEGI